MSVQQTPRQEPRAAAHVRWARSPLHVQRAAETASEHGTVMTAVAAKWLAVVRVVTGFTFLWAFLDKTFGFGYATPAAKAWINGGHPPRAS